MSSEATYSSKNCDNKILNHESTKTIKNKKLPNDISTKMIGESNYHWRFFTKWHK